MNIYVLILAALIPMVVGFIWYNPKVFGNAWMQASGMTDEKVKSGNMLAIMGISLVLSFLLAFAMQSIVIHQMGVSSIFMDPSLGKEHPDLKEFMDKYGTMFRTFKHGALHGTLAGFTLALPILGTNAMFERKGFKYIAVNCGYWIVTLALMGGVICQFA